MEPPKTTVSGVKIWKKYTLNEVKHSTFPGNPLVYSGDLYIVARADSVSRAETGCRTGYYNIRAPLPGALAD